MIRRRQAASSSCAASQQPAERRISDHGAALAQRPNRDLVRGCAFGCGVSPRATRRVSRAVLGSRRPTRQRSPENIGSEQAASRFARWSVQGPSRSAAHRAAEQRERLPLCRRSGSLDERAALRRTRPCDETGGSHGIDHCDGSVPVGQTREAPLSVAVPNPQPTSQRSRRAVERLITPGRARHRTRRCSRWRRRSWVVKPG
jgi:hypothetical protein